MIKAEVYPLKLGIGTILQLKRMNSNDETEYKSKVLDIVDHTVMIDYPSDVVTEKTAFFLDGTEFHCTFIDEMKVSYRFQTHIKGRRKTGIPMLEILYPGDRHLEKIQRREFVRVDANLDVAVEVDQVVQTFVTSDISAGGIAVNLKDSKFIKEQALVQLLIVLPFSHREIEYARCDAKVVRIWEQSERRIASIEFLNLSDAERQKITQFCFERQLLIRKKTE